MSHFTEIKTRIKDIEALRPACQELGLRLIPNTEAMGYYENKTKPEYHQHSTRTNQQRIE